MGYEIQTETVARHFVCTSSGFYNRRDNKKGALVLIPRQQLKLKMLIVLVLNAKNKPGNVHWGTFA
jgi:hypothetical protein